MCSSDLGRLSGSGGAGLPTASFWLRLFVWLGYLNRIFFWRVSQAHSMRQQKPCHAIEMAKTSNFTPCNRLQRPTSWTAPSQQKNKITPKNLVLHSYQFLHYVIFCRTQTPHSSITAVRKEIEDGERPSGRHL